MLKRVNINNESGITLIEVLVTLLIVTIVSGLVTGVMISSVNYNKKAHSHINLRQEANLIISSLREKLKEEEFTLCYQDLLGQSDITFEDISLQNQTIEIDKETPCGTIKTDQDLIIEFTLKDNLNNSFDVDMTIQGKESLTSSKEIIVEIPEFTEEDDYYDIIKNENVFVASKQFEFAGSTINGNGSTMLIKGNLLGNKINGGALINVSNIYVEGDVDVDGGSAGLGSETNPGIIVVGGNLNLWNGTRPINGDVYVKKNMKLKDGKVNGNVYVKENLELGWTPQLVGNSKIFYGGSLTHPNNYNQSILSKVINQNHIDAQEMIKYDIPPLKDDHWFVQNGYNLNIVPNNMKLFGNNINISSGNIPNHGYVSNFHNAIIISKGDVTIRGGDLKFSGVVIAPFGSVTFHGSTFEGTVIARDGFYVTSGGSTVTFKNIDNYINNKNDSPFNENF
ncbi:prepilin-type N-terminal cleavage/methylation domain-containing protein [Sutcliffiella cohnii]